MTVRVDSPEVVLAGGIEWIGRNSFTKLKATGYDGTITLEVFSPQREDLLLSRNSLRGWWDAPEQRGGQHGPMEKNSQP
jgi:hypothetical protein